MAGILQLRRGLKSTYISEGTNLAEAFFVTTAESGSISANNLIIGVSGSVGDDVITLAKLSLANKDNTYADYNSGSFWITGDYTGSNMILSDDAIISGSVFIEQDLHVEGHFYLGSGSDGDVVTVKSDFSGSLIPDNDDFGVKTPVATTAYHDLGTNEKRWKNIYLQRDVASGSDGGFLSGSHIDLTGNIVVDNLGRFGTAVIDDLTDNHIMLVAQNGQVIEDDNLTYDGQDFRLSNSDYYQIGTGASFQFDGSGMDITGSISNFELRVDNGIVFTNEFGTLDNQSTFTWDGGTLYVDGNISGSGTLEIDGQSTLASLKIEDLTEDRITIAGVGGEVEDDQYFRYTGNEFIIGSAEHFKVETASGNTFISGAVQMFSTLNVDDQSTLASVNVEDLTDNRVVIVGAGGEIEDDGNFTFNGTELNIGTGNFTVQQGSGNTQILGTLDVDSQSTLSSLNVEDLTDNRIVIAGTNGEIEDDGNFTFDGTELNIGTGNFTVQQGSGNTQIVGTLDVDSQSTLSSVNVEDLTSGRVVLAGTSGEIEDSGNLTFDGSLLTVTGDTTITGDLTVQGDTTQLNVSTLNVEDKNILIASGAADASAANGGGITIDGANATLLYGSSDDSFTFNKLLKVNGNISGSSFNGTTLLSSSNENFADYSQSVDSRLDEIEGPMSTSLDSRLIEIFATGSDHETRLDAQELYSSSFTSNDLDMNGNKVLFGNVYSTEGDLPAAGTYHGMFAHVHGTGKGYFAHGGNWIPLLNESTFTTDSASFDSRLDVQESFSSSIESHLPDGVVSGSAQITDGSGIVSGSVLITLDGTGVVSGSSQITDGSDIVSGSVLRTLDGTNVFSGSLIQGSNITITSGSGNITINSSGGGSSDFTTLTNVPSGLVSGSSQITDGSGIVSGSNFATTSSNNFTGNQTITGSLSTSGDITTGQYIRKTDDGTYPYINLASEHEIRFGLTNSEHVSIGPGRVHIGSQASSGFELELGGIQRFSGDKQGIIFDGHSSPVGGNIGNISFYAYTPGNPDTQLKNDNNGNFVILHNERPFSGNKFKIDSSGNIHFNDAYKFPTSDGSANQVLQTDGSGVLSFGTVSEFTGSVNITDSMNLAAQDPLPSGNIGDLAVSGSNLFFYNGAWTQVV